MPPNPAIKRQVSWLAGLCPVAGFSHAVLTAPRGRNSLNPVKIALEQGPFFRPGSVKTRGSGPLRIPVAQ